MYVETRVAEVRIEYDLVAATMDLNFLRPKTKPTNAPAIEPIKAQMPARPVSVMQA